MRSLAQQALRFPDRSGNQLPAIDEQAAAAEAMLVDRFRTACRTWSPRLRKQLANVLGEFDRRDHEHEAREVLTFLNAKRPGKRGFEATDANLRLICARLAEGATVEEMRAVIAVKARDTQRRRANGEPVFDERYLRPATLFNATRWSQYVGELGAGA